MIGYLLLFVAVSASLPSSSAAEPSSSARRWKYDVFLSFRGPDTRKSVTFELYDRLHRRGIKTFKDDTDLEVGHPIAPTLDATIEESRFAIVVLSPNYASSTWCLEELRKIFQCMKDENRILPIFYHVDPSDARHRRKKSFEEAFTKHENSGQHRSEKVQQWRDALEKMASISGWHTQNFRNDRELVDAIVDFVGITDNIVLLIVYEYMPNGSLDKHLFSGPENATLGWSDRYKIVAGVASALHYLHAACKFKVVHKNIKASNIMLDSDFNARLGDFGLAHALDNKY